MASKVLPQVSYLISLVYHHYFFSEKLFYTAKFAFVFSLIGTYYNSFKSCNSMSGIEEAARV